MRRLVVGWEEQGGTQLAYRNPVSNFSRSDLGLRHKIFAWRLFFFDFLVDELVRYEFH
jgi:hypothetical protein